MSLLVKANIDAKIADHAALTTGLHGVGSLHIAGFYSAGEEVSKVIWKDVSQTVLSDSNRTVDLDWTDLDLTGSTSANAKFAILLLRMKANTIGTGSSCQLKVRKNGTTPAYYPEHRIDKEGITAGFYINQEVIVGLDSGQVLEYAIEMGVGWDVNSRIVVLGYIE